MYPINDPLMATSEPANVTNGTAMTDPTLATTGTTTSDVASSLGAAAQQAAGQVQQQAGQVINQVQQQAGNVAQQVQHQTRAQLAAQKDGAAQALSGVAQAVRQIGDQIQQSGQAPLAKYANDAATQIEQTSTYLHEKSVDQLISDVEGFARRQPALFVAGGLVLGVIAARFIKSSSQHQA